MLLTTDGIVWNKEEFLIDLAMAMAKHESIIVDTNTEGPDLNTLNFYDWIDRIAQETNYDLTKMTVVTGNIFETHPKIKMEYDFPWCYFSWGQDNAAKPCKPKQFDHNFKTFASFVSRGNHHRLRLASYLYANYKKLAIQTYHFDKTSDYHLSNLGLDNFVKYNGVDQLSQVQNLLDNCPMTLDSVYSYPILHPHGYGLTDHYQHFFVEIVTETYSQGNTFFPTEKIWRPISQMTPFIVQGPQHYMTRLHRMGFQSFNQWWEEGHNLDPYEYQPVLIERLIDMLAQKSLQELEQMYTEMKPVLEHNHARLLEIRNKDPRILEKLWE